MTVVLLTTLAALYIMLILMRWSRPRVGAWTAAFPLHYNAKVSWEETELNLSSCCVLMLSIALAGTASSLASAPASRPGVAPGAGLGQGNDWGIDLDGHKVERLTQPETRVVVLFFTASDCPISNRYIPEIARLRREFRSRPIAFWWVFPNPGDTRLVVREHERAFQIEGNTVLDTAQTLVRLAHATVTPEAAVFRVANGALQQLYRGRVDDRYLSLGKERPQATQHFLEDAISAALTGSAIAQPVTQPVGCSIEPMAAR